MLCKASKKNLKVALQPTVMRMTMSKKRVVTNYSSVGDENDDGVDWVRPQTSVLHCSHLPGDDDDDDDDDLEE